MPWGNNGSEIAEKKSKLVVLGMNATVLARIGMLSATATAITEIETHKFQQLDWVRQC